MASYRRLPAQQPPVPYSRASGRVDAVVTALLTMAFIVLVGLGGLMLLWASVR